MKTSTLALRYIKENYIRSLLTMLAIMLSTILVCGISMFGTSLDHNIEVMQSSMDELDDFSINEQFDSTLLDAYKTKIETSQKVINVGTIQLETQHYANIYAVNNSDLTPIYILDGKMPNNANEILINDAYAKSKDVQVGDIIEITYGDRYKNNQISNDLDSSDDEVFKEFKTKEYTISGISVLRRMSYPYIMIDSFYTFPDETMKERPYNILYKYNESVSEDEKTNICNVLQNADMNILCRMSNMNDIHSNFMITDIFPFIILLVIMNAYAILKNIFAISFQERLRYFGTLSCIGATRKQIRKTLYFEIIVLSIISILIGVIISYFGTGILVKTYSDLNLQSNVGVFPMELKLSVKQIGISVIFIFVIILLCVYRASKALDNFSAIQLWQGKISLESRRKHRKIRKLTLIKSKRLERDLGKRYRSLYKYRYRSITIACVISIVVYLTGSYVTNAMSPRSTSDEDILDIQLINTSSYEKLNEVVMQSENFQKEVNASSFFYSSMMNFNSISIPYDVWSNEYVDELGIPEMNDVQLFLYGVPDEVISNYTTDKNTALLLDVYYDNDNNTKRLLRDDVLKKVTISQSYIEGDVRNTEKISLDYNSKNIAAFNEIELDPYRYGVSHHTPLYIIMPLTMYQDVISKFNGTTFQQDNYVRFYDCDPVRVRDEVSAYREKNSNFIRRILLEDNQESSIGFMLDSLMSCFSMFLGIICISGLCNIIFSNIITREKEYAVLESTGMTRKQLFKVILVENMSVISAAILIAIPISLLLTFLLFSMYELTPTFQFPIKECILILVITILSTFSIVYSACYKIRKKSIMERVKSDNL